MRARRLGAACAVVAVVCLPAGAARADAPVKTGWWNATSANGMSFPAPGTGADDLHVGQGPAGPSAYAAVAYDVAGQSVIGATLTLKVVANSAVGTTDVLACPTADATWKSGGNQPISAAPAYDCARGLPGIRATDGMSVSFLLGLSQQLAGGGFALAIVPAADALPFSVNFAKPDATSLTPDPAGEEPVAPTDPDVVAPPPPADPGTGTSGSVGLLPGTSGDSGFVAAPPAMLPDPAPLAAPTPVPSAPSYAPVAAGVPVAPVSNRERYQAGTLLALLSGAMVWAWQQPSRERRKIGGLARSEAPEAVQVDAQPRGIGRFAVARTAPARPLL